MGDNRGDGYASRRAELERQFQALPATGTAEYWHRIDDADARGALPLEVLARCIRERRAAGAGADAERIFECVVRRIQRPTDLWAWRIAKQARGGAQRELKEELEQECYLELWQELTDDGPTFLMESFGHGLMRLQQHVATDVMQKAGEWKRSGVASPRRVPRSDVDSLQAEPLREDEDPIAERVADPAAERAFERADLSDLRDRVMRLAPEQRGLILDRFWRDRTQEELAAERNITPRTVYNRLKQILRQLGIDYAGGEEVQHG